MPAFESAARSKPVILDDLGGDQPVPDKEDDQRADETGALMMAVQAGGLAAESSKQAPAAPRTMVTTKLLGLLGPGISRRAIPPAAKPTDDPEQNAHGGRS
jgi:hypothetical protein